LGEPGHVGVGETVAVEDDRDRISPVRCCCEDVYLCECPALPVLLLAHQPKQIPKPESVDQ
jgi:hypothetical protein